MPQPVPPSAAKSAQMSRVRNAGTAPETAVRRELHRRGLRYRVNMPLPEVGGIRPDIVFTRVRVAIFIDGCFWHRCPEHGTSPKTNAGWWRRKLDSNVERDRKTDTAVAEAGWTVVRIWEHEDPINAADRIERIVRSVHRPDGALVNTP